jgi:hypothetical protein
LAVGATVKSIDAGAFGLAGNPAALAYDPGFPVEALIGIALGVAAAFAKPD